MRYCLLILCSTLFIQCAPRYQLDYPPARWTQEADPQLFKLPKEREETTVWDAVDLEFFYQFERIANLGERSANIGGTVGIANSLEALNANNFDEVADSSWFTNRIGRRPMTIDEIVRGPRTGTGPKLDQPWTIKSAKTTGLTPGLLIKDSLGDYYLIKFDVTGSSELASGVEIIGTLIFHAFGFNVPENFVMNVSLDQFKLGEKATTKNSLGKKGAIHSGST